MGSFYTFKCKKCGHEEKYRLGTGLADFDDPQRRKEDEAAEAAFRKDVSDGKFGSHLSQITAINPDSYRYDTNDSLFFCSACDQLSLGRRKQITQVDDNHQYHFVITVRQPCPLCGLPFFYNEYTLGGFIAKCPECGEKAFEADSWGFFD